VSACGSTEQRASQQQVFGTIVDHYSDYDEILSQSNRSE
jgi:hypothetical protein